MLRRHHQGSIHECHCGSVFVLLSQLKAHRAGRHGENVFLKVRDFFESSKVLNRTGPFICDRCGTEHSNRSKFVYHLRSKHLEDKKFLCDLCPKSTILKSWLAKHMRVMHLKLRPFQCHICRLKTSTKRALRIHMMTHGSKTKCKVCHKMVSNMAFHLKNHIAVKCPVCDKTYTKLSIAAHLTIHNQRCIDCEEVLPNRKALKM